MRVHRGHIAEFVHAKTMFFYNPFTGTSGYALPGLGEFVPGKTLFPYNPIREGIARAGLGEFVHGKTLFPYNPIREGLSGCSGGCGCGGKCGGMGDISTTISDAWTSLNSHMIIGMPLGYLAAGAVAGAAVVLLWPSGSGKGRRRR